MQRGKQNEHHILKMIYKKNQSTKKKKIKLLIVKIKDFKNNPSKNKKIFEINNIAVI